ncbi:hypothetical protein MRB53_038614 [Persea americana]|nr:hypothetical protein MRB53_038614 [Persea americana]
MRPVFQLIRSSPRTTNQTIDLTDDEHTLPSSNPFSNPSSTSFTTPSSHSDALHGDLSFGMDSPLDMTQPPHTGSPLGPGLASSTKI